jgi:hypothetical protein
MKFYGKIGIGGNWEKEENLNRIKIKIQAISGREIKMKYKKIA